MTAQDWLLIVNGAILGAGALAAVEALILVVVVVLVVRGGAQRIQRATGDQLAQAMARSRAGSQPPHAE